MRIRNKILTYAEIGWAVLPLHNITEDGQCSCGNPQCSSKGKHPRIYNGSLGATTDKKQIEDWWNLWPDANVGIATGRKSNLIVVDVDGPEGQESLAAYGISLPETVTAISGREGGFHLYYQCPSDVISNKTNFIHKVDIRGEGGYVVAPPSNHVSSRAYHWQISPDTNSISPFPKVVLEIIKAGSTNKVSQSISTSSTLQNDLLSISPKIKSELGVLALATSGERNDTLFKVSCNIFESSASGLINIDTAKSLLIRVACQIGLNDSEIEKTIASALRRVQDKNLFDASTYLSPLSNSIPQILGNSDVETSNYFAERYKDKLRFCEEDKAWLMWDGSRWKKVSDPQVKDLGKVAIQEIQDNLNSQYRQGRNLQSLNSINSMIELSKGRFCVEKKLLDNQRFLLPVNNGTIDLKSGLLIESKPQVLMTKKVNVTYDSHAICPLFNSFINRVTLGDSYLQDFIQKCVGYSVSGSIDEQCMFILLGDGQNGKSVFVELLRKLMGDYSQTIHPSMLMNNLNQTDYETAKLAGVRLAVATETERGKNFAESTIKRLTGGDTITARQIYGHPFSFEPNFKIWMTTNHLPVIDGSDKAIKRRLIVIPFRAQISNEEKDGSLLHKLEAEMDGILNWAIDGCIKWQREGLIPPQSVSDATQAYFEDMDSIGKFLNQRCTFNSTSYSSSEEIQLAYNFWCSDNEEAIEPWSSLVKRLKTEGCIPKKIKQSRGWMGIGINRCPISQ